MAHLPPDWRDRFALSGHKAPVSGASKGSGATMCEVFAQAGADIMAEWRDEVGLAEVARAICPSVVMTPMVCAVWGKPERDKRFHLATPTRRFAETVEMADAAPFLASDALAIINGDLLMVEGGFTSV